MEIKDCEDVLYEINKSKFLGYAYSVNNVDEVEKRLIKLNKLHDKATHVCYAYVLSSPQAEKCSDDGEPDGTAGRPMLEVLKKNGFVNTLIVVVRYFGGIKLGAGGLVRAYSTSAKNTLDMAEKVEYVICTEYKIKTSINNKKTFQRLQNEYMFDISSQMYTSEYQATLSVVDCKDLDKAFEENDIIIIEKNVKKTPKK